MEYAENLERAELTRLVRIERRPPHQRRYNRR